MQSVLVGFAALLQATALSPSPEWRVVAYGANGSQLSTDLARLNCKAAVCSATELTEYLHPTPIGVSKAVDDVQYDCDRASTRTLAETSFDVRGHQLAHLGVPTPWALLEAGSMGFQSMAFACSPRQAEPKTNPAATVPTAPGAPAGAALQAPASGSGASVQIASSPTANGANSALARMAEASPEAAGLKTFVERAVVRGHITFRALLTGFGSQADARAFCQRLQPADGCLVRPSKPKG